MIRVRVATLDDLAEIVPRSQQLCAHESIKISDELLEAALRQLLGDASLGAVWLIEDADVIGYAIVTYGYDLEFSGRDSYLTEIWIDEPARGQGSGTQALAALGDEL